MASKSSSGTVSSQDVRFIFVDLRDSGDWDAVERLLDEAQFPFEGFSDPAVWSAEESRQ
jgi:hypothetical protein